MILLEIPLFQSANTPEYISKVEKIYSADFCKRICDVLKIKETDKEKFKGFIIDAAASYLAAKEMTADRIQKHEQIKVFKNYLSALENTKIRYEQILESNLTDSNFHDALKDIIKNCDDVSLKDMFEPYIVLGDGEKLLGSYSTTLFSRFLDTLIEASKKAPDYINENDKADLGGDCILWWVNKLSLNWPRYTDVPLTIGDWHKDLEDNAGNKSGMYKSSSADVLTDLLQAIDKKVTRSDIETAIRKYKKL